MTSKMNTQPNALPNALPLLRALIKCPPKRAKAVGVKLDVPTHCKSPSTG
jgi:hypothetical protein